MHHSMVEWPLSPCSESAGGGPYAWSGKLVMDLDVFGMIGLGLPLNHSQHSPPLQARVDVGLPTAGLPGVLIWLCSKKVTSLYVTTEREGEAGIGRMPPLNAYSPISGGLSRYSDWVIQCANEIYPIVGISYVGHKLQLLADFS